MNIPISEYRRMAREAMKGRFAYLTLIVVAASLPGLSYFGGALTPPLALAAAALALLSALLGYGRENIFLNRFRGAPDGPALLIQLRMLPKVAAVFLLRDALPAALLELGARLPVSSYQQLSRASGLQMAGLILQAVMVYNYGMAEYMLVNDPAQSPLEALRRSRRTLSGNRLRLLLLSLSFVGWVLLARIPDVLCLRLFPNMGALASSAVSLVWTAPLLTYVHMSQTAFFEVIAGHKAVPAPEYAPAPAPPQPARPAVAPEDAAAWKALYRHGFIRSRLEADGEAGVLSGLSPEKEAQWRSEWLRERIARYPDDPDGMDDALLCAAEASDGPALRQAVAAMDAALASGQVVEGMIARQALGLARALSAADLDPEAAREIRAEAAALAGRLEKRLNQIDPGGGWQAAIEEILALTGEG